ncbi:MAG: 4-alpha-glucanotransferase, partial [Alphaproteobacteria bacterium]|nr:4-alpha-glucanotransferase [Alphaproteobacteria bacterium]
MPPLESLARLAGIAVNWTDANRRRRRVSQESLRAILQALNLPAGSKGEIADSRVRLRERQQQLPMQVVAEGQNFFARGKSLRLLGEDGKAHDLRVAEGRAKADLPPGYYRFEDHDGRLAVTPPRAFRPDRKVWGVAAQLYALRGSPGFGDFGALGRFSEQAAGAGADAIMLSPVHALPPGGVSPYSPTSRRFLNPLYIPASGRDAGTPLINWSRATDARLKGLRRAFQDFEARGHNSAFA